MARKPTGELNLAALRAQAQKKPCTKAGQVRQAWPEIRHLLASGHRLKDVWIWLKEIGIDIPYTRLCEYVNQLRRAGPPPSEFRSQGAAVLPATTPVAVPKVNTATAGEKPSKHDPLANVRRSEASRPGFHYRPAVPEDEKDLI
jgi:hypothetical protein